MASARPGRASVRKVSGKTKVEVRDKLCELHEQVDVSLRQRRRYTVGPRLLRWEHDGNTCAIHERSRLIPADPGRPLMTLANGSAEHPNWTVVAADTVLQNQRAARRVAGALDSRPPLRPPPLTPRRRGSVSAGRSRQSVMLDLVVSVQHACLVDEFQRPPAVSRRPDAQSAAGRVRDHVRTERFRSGR